MLIISQPKYWCKHCKIFIRDTKPAKTEHEATPKHQGNLKRFLRDLHRGVEQEERDKQRAKNEVARLNGMVAEGGLSSAASSSGYGQGTTLRLPKPPATADQIKVQRAQLAELGVAIPDEFRPDLAMTGEWQVVSERIIESEGEKKPDAIALGVRKREDRDEDEDELEAKKMRYESRFRTHPVEDEAGDLDALLSNVTRIEKLATKTEPKDEAVSGWVAQENIKQEPLAVSNIATTGSDVESSIIKTEPLDEESTAPTVTSLTVGSNKPESEGSLGGIVFKKRKAKNIRQK